ncbi:hypothetical protein PF010_g27563 [Phytophthora fragariae]|uniref:Uncharacterized protein n=1 Tax=Phytophthora fragariae TaxID=53985 RepID=A0A6G0JUH7_9STRA|nr:hypothetical protein PF010_g27563 [Phytophthora fragariae]
MMLSSRLDSSLEAQPPSSSTTSASTEDASSSDTGSQALSSSENSPPLSSDASRREPSSRLVPVLAWALLTGGGIGPPCPLRDDSEVPARLALSLDGCSAAESDAEAASGGSDAVDAMAAVRGGLP